MRSTNEGRCRERRTPPLLLLAALPLLMSGCGEAPTEPTVETPEFELPVAMQHGDARAVAGFGSFTVGEGLIRNYWFIAGKRHDGTVRGRFGGFNQASGGRIAGRVTCFSVQGDQVWIGGVIERANFDVVGQDTGWRAEDNGRPGGATPDRLSFAVPVSSAADFCADRPLPPPAGLGLVDLERGDIRIRD